MDANTGYEGGSKNANILVAGITGTGKSTLINAVFHLEGKGAARTGIGKPITDHMDEYSSPDIPIRIWDTVGLELDSAKTQKSIDDICSKIVEKGASNNAYERIHAIWYCVNSHSHRYEGAEVAFVKQLHDLGVPFIIVITQCTEKEDAINQFREKIKSVNKNEGMDDIEVIPILAEPYETAIGDIPSFGLDGLVDMTTNSLPSYLVGSFVAAQQISRERKRQYCEELIYNTAREAMEGAADNIWLVNVLTTRNKVNELLKTIAQTFNTILDEEELNRALSQCELDFENIFFGLIWPLEGEYGKRINALFEDESQKGMSVKVKSDVPKRNRSARMIAYYGYIFIDSAEQLWDDKNEREIEDIYKEVDKLVQIINENLKKHREKMKRYKI